MSRRAMVLAVLALGATIATPLRAQTRNGFQLVGYGSAGWSATGSDPFTNNFVASVSPLILYTVGDNLLFETELEFGLEGATTETTLEYAQIDYLGFDRVQLTAGKLLLPFGVFGERLHPSWINKLPSKPLVFGAGHGGGAAESLLPVLSDAGLSVRFKQPFASIWSLNVSAYVTQGPTTGVGGHDEEPVMDVIPGPQRSAEGALGESPAPSVMFGAALGEDNNSNKMVGGRVGLVRGGMFEVYASALRAKYDEASSLAYTAAALSAEYRRAGFELRTEAVLTRQEVEHEPGEIETLGRSGLYVQVSRRSGPWEPVVRWSSVAEAKVAGEAVADGHDELAVGLDYWLAASVPLKLAWDFHPNRDDTFTIQWAFGF